MSRPEPKKHVRRSKAMTLNPGDTLDVLVLEKSRLRIIFESLKVKVRRRKKND